MRDRKKEIIDKALQLFAKKGYVNTSVNDIRKVVHLSKGGFYYHFGSKEEIADSILSFYLEKMLNSYKLHAKSKKNATSKLILLSNIHLHIIDKESLKGFRSIIISLKGAKLREMMQKKIQKVFKPIIADILEEGISKKEFKIDSVEVATYFIFNLPELMLRLPMNILCDKKKNEQYKLALTKMIEALLGVRKNGRHNEL